MKTSLVHLCKPDAKKKPPPTSPATKANGGKTEDIMKVRGNGTSIMPRNNLAKARKVCQQESGAESQHSLSEMKVQSSPI